MVATDFLSQALQYFLNILPGNVTFNLIALLTLSVTLCTIFWHLLSFLKKNMRISGKNDEKKII